MDTEDPSSDADVRTSADVSISNSPKNSPVHDESRSPARMEVDGTMSEHSEADIVKEEVSSACSEPDDASTPLKRPAGGDEAVSAKKPRTELADGHSSPHPLASPVKSEPALFASCGRSGSEVGPPVWRPCDHRSCLARRPLCLSLGDARCSLSALTARWWHLSPGEHFCANCREGLAARRCTEASVLSDFSNWLRKWPVRAQEASSPPLHYFAAAKLPFWARCSRCAKWRQVPRRLEAGACRREWLQSFTCALLVAHPSQPSCDVPEDERVDLARSEDFLDAITYQPLLQASPVSHLSPGHPPHALGLLSAADVDPRPEKESTVGSNGCSGGSSEEDDEEEENDDVVPISDPNGQPKRQDAACAAPPKFLSPFARPGSPPLALQMPPDEILPEEALECEELTSQKNLRPLYLGLRNLVVGLWSLNVKQWLTPDAVCNFLWLRGLLRIPLTERILPRLLCHLTERGCINFGLLPAMPQPLRELLALPEERQFKTVIVGAGLTGLIAARQLRTLGLPVTLLEAEEGPGGQLRSVSIPREVATRGNGDTIRLPLGEHLLLGAVNNPLSVLSHQAGWTLMPVPDTAVLFSADNGGPVPTDVEARSEFHFLAVLERIRRERDAYVASRPADRLEDKSFEEEYVKANRCALEKFTDMTEEHLSLLRFFEADLEAANLAPMSAMSWLSWDAAERSAQLGGGPVLPNGDPNALGLLCERLAEGLDVRFGCRVAAIEEDAGQAASGGLLLRTADGQRHPADRVLLTGASASLLGDAEPPLGPPAGERLALLFRERFWDAQNGAGDGLTPGQLFFGRVTAGEETRGLFHLFEDLDPVHREVPVLRSGLFGEALASNASSALLDALSGLFPGQDADSLRPIWSSSRPLGEPRPRHAPAHSKFDDRCLHSRQGETAAFAQGPASSFLRGLSGAFRLTCV